MAKDKPTKNNKKMDLNSFFRLPLAKRLEVMNDIADKANMDQQKLMDRYDREFATAN